MSDPGTAAVAAKPLPNPPPAPAPAPNAAAKLFSELKVSAHLMTFEAGLYCIVQTPGTRRPDDGTGLPGVRISLPPASNAPPDAVTFASFRPDGWLSGQTDALLVRVAQGPTQVLVTIYQAPIGSDTAPRLQVLRLSEDAGAAGFAPGAPDKPMAANAPRPQGFPGGVVPEVVAHAQIKGDIGASFGEWIGEKGSKRWIEGFMLNPRGAISPADVEYQAVLGRGWLSPWVEGGQLCGSRGMALPVLGLRLRLRGPAAEAYDIRYAATFVDGTEIGPVKAGEPCEADTLSPLEAFQIMLTAKPGAPGLEHDEEEVPERGAPKVAPRSIRGKPPAGKKR